MLNTLMTLINACEDDVDFFIDHSNTLHLTINDFDGSSDWKIIREYDNPKAVNVLENWLEDNCIFQTGDFRTLYFFDGFCVELGYSSFNI